MNERGKTTEERLVEEANQQESSRILEETPPGPIGSTIAFKHKGFLGFGNYEIIHKISQDNCGWNDSYYREPPKKHSFVKIRCEKVTSQ